MKQFCIRLDEKTFNTLQQKAQDKALKLSEYIRRLVELGLRIEEMSEKKSGKNNGDSALLSDLGSSKSLWEKELAWTLEMRFLMRFLVDKLLYGKGQTDGNLLQESKLRAENFVAGLFNEDFKEN